MLTKLWGLSYLSYEDMRYPDSQQQTDLVLALPNGSCCLCIVEMARLLLHKVLAITSQHLRRTGFCEQDIVYWTLWAIRAMKSP